MSRELTELEEELIEVLKIARGHILEICTCRNVPIPASTINRIIKVLSKAKEQ